MIDLDAKDLERARRGDVQALDALFRVYGDRVYRLCLALLGQAADAEDAASEVLLRILDKARTFSGRSRFSTWVYRLAMNHCLNRRKQRGRRPAPLALAELSERDQPPSPWSGPLEATSLAEERSALRELLGRLGPEQRAVVVLREVEGLSYQEIAEVLQLPLGTVMSRLSRGRARLVELAGGVGAVPARDAVRSRW